MSFLTIVSLGFIPTLYAAGAGPAEQTLQSRFIELPSESRRLTGPLYWLHGDESAELLDSCLQKVAEGGNGCFTAESRPHNDWLGEGWYRDLQICLEAAKKYDLDMWIFDEKWWPSGEVGGEVPLQYGSKYMQAEAVDVPSGEVFSCELSEDKLIAVLAGKTAAGKIEGNSLIDLTGKVKNGSLSWQAPQGSWQVLVFTWRYCDGRGGSYLIDGASKEAVDWYLETVYQPHYDRFAEDFGGQIKGFFYDEPETLGDWGTEVIPMLKERNVDWKKALAAWKFELSGDEQQAAKYQYQDAFAETWGRTLFGAITDWCHEHDVQSIGHFLEHGQLYLSQWACAGNMFQLQKYSDMGAIDAVFSQFVMGKRERNYNKSCWQTPKLGSSISHVYGKKDDLAMIEIFGARGQDLTYPEMKWWTDHMQVSGINFHIPHSFNPRAPYDTDCPPYFYNGGREPRWPLYKVYADYTSRLSLMLSGGRHVCPVALLFAGNSVHVGKAVAPDQISGALQEALYDCDWMPYDVFEDDVKLAAERMSLHAEEYGVLIVPPVEVIPSGTLKKAYDFFSAGGIVIGYDFLPSKPADLSSSSAEIARLREAIWGKAEAGVKACRSNSAGGRSYFLPANPTPEQIKQALAGDAGLHPTLEVVEGETDNWLHVLHRVKDGRDVFFICNQNVDDGPRTLRLRIRAGGFPEYWDPMRAEITSIPFTRSGDYVELALTFAPSEAALLVFNPVRRNLPRHIDAQDLQAAKALSVIQMKTDLARTAAPSPSLAGCDWIWYPGLNASASAPQGSCYFRGHLEIPAGKQLATAKFIGTADNEMTLYVNGNPITDNQGSFANWRKLSDVDVLDFLTETGNTIAISVLNATDEPSPAGLVGEFILTCQDGTTETIKIDSGWKVQNFSVSGWETARFDDSGWAKAEAVAAFGSGPWGTPGATLTVSPVAQARPFAGMVKVSEKIITGKTRLILSMKGIEPEQAARITVNGAYAGGCIGAPMHKDITGFLKSGTNTIVIEPFAPGSVELLLCP
ncbi:MAG: glycosyl hydrolase [Phycisphaerae bacterium]